MSAAPTQASVRHAGSSPAPKVLCAMSGGVDSSMAAALLKDQGFDVTGAMLRFWQDERPADQFSLCCSPDAAYDARRIADMLELPFYLFDARDEFEHVVIDPFVPTYQQGHTPNPCVHCNQEIKFGSFWQKARMLGCDYMATGHYVKRVDSAAGVELHRGDDDSKDQTYFLWAIDADVLPHLLFPLAQARKEDMRDQAEARGFSTAHKKSSHSLCFITSSVKDYLLQFSQSQPGAILDASDGYKEIGQHQGVQFYTIGQRKGLGLYHSHLERFVLEIRGEDNSLIVGTRDMCYFQELYADSSNFLLDPTALPSRLMAQTRYRQQACPAELELLDQHSFRLRFDEPMFAIATGQSAVLYDGSRLLGGGIIRSRH